MDTSNTDNSRELDGYDDVARRTQQMKAAGVSVWDETWWGPAAWPPHPALQIGPSPNAAAVAYRPADSGAVSYTHLTLPTICSV